MKTIFMALVLTAPVLRGQNAMTPKITKTPEPYRDGDFYSVGLGDYGQTAITPKITKTATRIRTEWPTGMWQEQARVDLVEPIVETSFVKSGVENGYEYTIALGNGRAAQQPIGRVHIGDFGPPMADRISYTGQDTWGTYGSGWTNQKTPLQPGESIVLTMVSKWLPGLASAYFRDIYVLGESDNFGIVRLPDDLSEKEQVAIREHESEELRKARTIQHLGYKTYIVGPVFKPGSTADDVRAHVQGSAEMPGFEFLKDADGPEDGLRERLAGLKPSGPLQKQLVESLVFTLDHLTRNQ